MARPEKYNWTAIKEAFENGFDRDEICKKYKITPKILSNRINKEFWEVKGTVKAQIMDLCDNVHKTAQNISNLHPSNQEIAIEKINTMQQDNELIENNRKLAKMLQSVIVNNRSEINLRNIKSVSSTLKDIESIANPSPQTVINNSNNQQNNSVDLQWKLI